MQRYRWYTQEKIETPTRRVPCNIGYYAAIQTAPALGLLNILQREPYVLSDASWRVLGSDLEFDLEKVERLHAQGGDDTRTKSCSCMIL